MSFLRRISGKAQKRVVVLGLDGVSRQQLLTLCEDGHLPGIQKIIANSDLSEFSSAVSSMLPVTWTSCFTGVNPAVHGLFGYMERRRNAYGVYFPNGSQIASTSVWEECASAGKTIVSVNVPYTYPARKIKGVMVSGLDSLDFNKAVYPTAVGEALEKTGYRVDVDFSGLSGDRGKTYAALEHVLSKRGEAVRYLFKRVDWRLFICVFTGAGHLNRSLYNDYHDKRSACHKRFIAYFKKLDALVREIDDTLPADTELMLISTQSTVPAERMVNLNAWLVHQGLLVLKNSGKFSFDDINPEKTKVFALDGGRLYINCKGTMPGGCVNPGREYDKLRNFLIESLLTLVDDATGTPFISAIYRKEDVYHGPFMDRAPDLILAGISGYELNGEMSVGDVFANAAREGVPSGADTFFCLKGLRSLVSKPGIYDVFPTLLEILGIPLTKKIDGVSIF